MDTNQSAGMDAKKNAIESMSKDELLIKYKGLLGIAKQAKKAKDEFAEENQKLKEQLMNCETQREADKKSLLTMKEMLEEFTTNKLEMTTEISEIKGKYKSLVEERASMRNEVDKLSIENEALRRQLDRLTEDNESLLTDIDQMEQQLKQVNVLGMEQKQHLDLLELEVEKLKEYEVTSRQLETKLQDLLQANISLQESYNTSQTESQSLAAKYQRQKDINSEQRTEFIGLKERFIEVHKKLRQLQECKRVLVENHHEYADSISRWQSEIMQASEQLCNHIQGLTKENSELKREIETANGDAGIALPQLPVLIEHCERAIVEYRRQNEVIESLRRENEALKARAADEVDDGKAQIEALEELRGEREEIPSMFEEEVKFLRSENAKLNEDLERIKLQTAERLNGENVSLKKDEIAKIRVSSEAEVKLLQQAAKNQLNADNEVNLLRKENKRLGEELVSLKAEKDEEIRRLVVEISTLREEAIKREDNADEDVNILRTENLRLVEESSKAELRSDEEVKRLTSENSKSKEVAAKGPQSSDEETRLLEAENARLQEELPSAKLDSNEEVKHLIAENARLKAEAAELKTSTDEKIKQLETELSMLGEEAANAKLVTEEEVNCLRTDNHNLSKENDNLKSELVNLEKEATAGSLKAEETKTAEVKRLKQLNQALKDEIQAIRSASNTTDHVVLSHLPILIDSCERAMQEHRQQTELLEKLRRSSEFEHERAHEDLESLRAANANLEQELARTKNEADSQAKELESLARENESLKAEFSKARQTEAEVQEVLSLRDDLLASTQLCEELQARLEKQGRENTDLLNEMRELNEALKGRGDVISRQQAKQQELVTEIKKTSSALAKIEADLNAKEAVIKEKESKIIKLSEDNHSALQEVNRLQNLSRDNELRIKSLSEEIASIRNQFETQSEVLSTSTFSRAEELARLREVDESFEEKYNKLRSLAVKLKKKAHEQSLCIADLEKQSADSKTKTTETCERITSLENERESLQKELKTCKNQTETLKAEVDKLKASKKQSNVLTLEIEAFEKSLNETSAKLTAKTAEYDLMVDTLQSKDAAIEVMKKEIKILEDSKESEKVHSIDLKKQIDKLQAQLKDVIHGKQEISAKLEESLSEKQTVQSDLDDVNQRLASIEGERNAERTTLLNEKERLLQTINSLEDELNLSNNRIALAERSLQDLHNEYSNYKVKAQSVLRQNQTKESSKERELEEELTLLKGEHKDLSIRLQTFQARFEASEKIIEELQEENRSLQRRNKDLMSTITELRQQTEILSQENKKQLETYQETLKGHRLQIEALDSCHLEQMQDLQAKYDREVAELRATQKKDSEVIPQKPLEKLDYILMEREDAEGSEAEVAHTPKYLPSAKRSSHDLVPLDELLSSPTVDSTYRRSISPSVELQETKERLHKQESRVRHLTALLAESEQDLARLTQLNEMLKEEVRRQERTVEREKHMHNSEYLKNVVLKFVSLSSGDERKRLVPVLNTILKLSPSETEMLQNVAEGKVADNNNRSWSSFLPHWGTS